MQSKIFLMHTALCIMCMLIKAYRECVGVIVRLGVGVGEQQFGTSAGGN